MKAHLAYRQSKLVDRTIRSASPVPPKLIGRVVARGFPSGSRPRSAQLQL